MTTLLRPTGLPGWAVQGVVTEPTAEKKAIGWGATGQSGERPPAEYFNWLQQQNEGWIRYLSYDKIVDDDFAGVTSPGGATGVPEGWISDMPSGMINPGSPVGANYLTVDGPLGIISFRQPSGFGAFYKGIGGAIGTRDFYISASWGRGNTPLNGITGVRIGFGLLSGTLRANNATGPCFFYTTGTSGYPWCMAYDGTMANFSIYPTLLGTSGFQVFSAERRGPTMVARVWCPVAGYEEKAFSAVVASGGVNFGFIAQHYEPGGQNFVHMLDWLRYGARRAF